MTTYIFTAIFILFALLSLRSLKYGVLFIIMATPFNLLIKVLLGMTLYSQVWHNLFILWLCLIVLGRAFVRARFDFKANRIDAVFIFMLFFAFMQLVYNYVISGNYYIAFQGVRNYYFGILLYFVVRSLVKGSDDVRAMAGAIMLVVLLSSAELVAEFILGSLGVISQEDLLWVEMIPESYKDLYSDSSAFATFPGLPDIIRPVGIFFSIQYSAAFTLIGALLGLSAWAGGKSAKGSDGGVLFKTPVFLVILAALILSTSRTVIFAFIMAALLMFVMHKMSLKKIALVLSSAFFVFITTGLWVYVVRPLTGGGDTHIDDTMEFIKIVPDLFSRMPLHTFFWGLGFNADPFARSVLGVSTLYDEFFSEAVMGPEGVFKFFLNVGVSGAVLFVYQNALVFGKGVRLARQDLPPFFKNLMFGFPFVVLGLCLASMHVMPLAAAGINYIYYVIVAMIASFDPDWHDMKGDRV